MRGQADVKTQKGLSNEKYFEKHEVWAELSEREERRIEETLALLPRDIKTILNVGCGDGRVTRSIAGQYQIVGVDLSATAAGLFHGDAAIGSIDALPFKDKSFDLALITEVLEHLPQHLYEVALREAQRVSSRYILVTVPYKETLEANYLRCGHCELIYHAWNHLRAFDRSNTAAMFSDFSVAASVELGVTTPYVPRWMYQVLQRIGKTWGESATALCPRCAMPHQSNGEGTLFGDLWQRIIWRLYNWAPFKKGAFLGVLYRRVNP